ncbi:hypothetical protein [Micromonospora sp. U56]|uniref:hypothetical protein n=1 Tax=Micromonospora sp. U56 TaxID=2824900 RepID=UPI001FFCAB5C|nr:hypothetical protein [Micromonospora sp. U56]
MEAADIEPGAVFRFPHDDRPNRVLFRDSDVVMYDAWWPHLKAWGLADLAAIKRQRISYYVTAVSTVIEKATHLRTAPLTADELTVHRPDLPFAAVQDVAMTWSSGDAGRVTDATAELSASGVYLLPFGPGGGTKAGVRVAADNGSAFAVGELFRKAQAVQARHLGDVLPGAGVGIYRSGLQRGLPAYYLWGAVSRLHDHLAAHGR